MGRRWTPDEEEFLKQHYHSMPMEELTRALGRSVGAIHQRAFLLRLRRPHPLQWPPSDIEYLKEHWATTPTRQICEALGRSYKQVASMAQRLGLYKEKPWIRYCVDPTAFDELTPNTAYLLGLIFADGCITDDRLVIYSTDYELVRLARSILKSDHPISAEDRGRFRTMYRLSIRDVDLLNRLANWGVTPRKSLTAQMPPVPDSVLPHFVRGYFDGDGNVHVEHSRRQIQVTICSGSKDFLDDLSKRIHSALPDVGLARVLPIRGKRCWKIKYYNRNAMLLADWMYKEAGDAFLSRKRRVFDDYGRLAQRLAG